MVAFGGRRNPLNDEGFQVTFGGTQAGKATALLQVTDASGASGFVGEIVRGGPPLNGGSSIVNTGNHPPVVTTPALYRHPDRGRRSASPATARIPTTTR